MPLNINQGPEDYKLHSFDLTKSEVTPNCQNTYLIRIFVEPSITN